MAEDGTDNAACCGRAPVQNKTYLKLSYQSVLTRLFSLMRSVNIYTVKISLLVLYTDTVFIWLYCVFFVLSN